MVTHQRLWADTTTGIRATNELFILEVIMSGCLDDLSPSEFASTITALVTEEAKAQDTIRAKVSPQVQLILEQIHRIARDLWRLERDFEIDISVEFSPTFCATTQMSAEGASWDQIRLATEYDEGDVVRSLRRTLDLCRQLARAPGMREQVSKLATEAANLIARDEVREDI